MHISQSGIRSSLPTTRFASTATRARQRQFGLRRSPSRQLTVRGADRARVPLLAQLRSAARSVTRPVTRPGTAQHSTTRPVARLRPSVSMTWSQPIETASLRPRPRSAAPWHG